MTPQQAYQEFLLKVNKNDTNANVKVPKSQFVLLFNEQKSQWLNDVITNNESTDYIEDIEELLTPDKQLTKTTSSLIKDNFTLPEDFFRRATAYVVASKGGCKNNVMTVWFIKPKNRDIYLQNSNLAPSFEYQETVAIVNSGQVSIFKTDFNIDEAHLTYYRKPIDLDIEGYIRVDGTPSTNTETDLSDDNTRIVINRTAAEALRNYESAEQVALAMQRPQ
jgi:hypothetical protein